MSGLVLTSIFQLIISAIQLEVHLAGADYLRCILRFNLHSHFLSLHAKAVFLIPKLLAVSPGFSYLQLSGGLHAIPLVIVFFDVIIYSEILFENETYQVFYRRKRQFLSKR